MRAVLRKDRKVYTITFDKYGAVDTVECLGKLLTSRNRVVQQIVNNQERIRRGFIPTGFTGA